MSASTKVGPGLAVGRRRFVRSGLAGLLGLASLDLTSSAARACWGWRRRCGWPSQAVGTTCAPGGVPPSGAMNTGDSICPMWLVGSSSTLYYYYGQNCSNPYDTMTYGFSFPAPVQTGCYSPNCTTSYYGGGQAARTYRPPVFCTNGTTADAAQIVDNALANNPFPDAGSTTHPIFYFYSAWVTGTPVDFVIPSKTGTQISIAACLYHWIGLLGPHFIGVGVEWAGSSSSAVKPDWGMPITSYNYLAGYRGRCYYMFTGTPVM